MTGRGAKTKRALWWAFLVIFIASGAWIGFYLYTTVSSEQTISAMNAELAAVRGAPATVQLGAAHAAASAIEPATPAYRTAQAAQPEATHTPMPTETPDPLLVEYQTLALKNPDMIGWVYIDGTKIDYPVMFTPGNPQKYLHKDFSGRYSFSGLPFLDARCDPAAETQNQILYAHNMRSGLMFAELHKYLDATYLQDHPTIHFDTLTRRGAYQVIGVLQVDLTGMKAPSMMCYSLFTTETQADVDALNSYIAQYATVKIGDVALNDRIVTLSTCQRLGSIDRLVVIARMPKAA